MHVLSLFVWRVLGRNSSQTEVLQSLWIPETCSFFFCQIQLYDLGMDGSEIKSRFWKLGVWIRFVFLWFQRSARRLPKNLSSSCWGGHSLWRSFDLPHWELLKYLWNISYVLFRERTFSEKYNFSPPLIWLRVPMVKFVFVCLYFCISCLSVCNCICISGVFVYFHQFQASPGCPARARLTSRLSTEDQR